MILRTENITHTYGLGTPFVKKALKGINLNVKKGEFMGLIGHTGSGKSTLIKHLNALEKPQEGRVLLDGEDIWEKPKEIRKVRFRVGLVFQYPEYQLFEETVEKDIAFGPRNMGLSEAEIKERVEEGMAFSGLKDSHRQRSPFELSGGQKRRVAIAGVIAMRPDVLILDEPTAGLDPKGRDDILEKINSYHLSKNSTVILVSHSMEDIAEVADRVVVLNDGMIDLEGAPAEVFKKSERLNEIGLGIPQVTRVVSSLKRHGIDLGSGIFTVAQAKKAVMLALKMRGRGGHA